MVKSFRRASSPVTIVRTVTVIMGTVVGLTFLFGFGNVLISLFGSVYLSGLRRLSRLQSIFRSSDFCLVHATWRSPVPP